MVKTKDKNLFLITLMILYFFFIKILYFFAFHLAHPTIHFYTNNTIKKYTL